MNPKSPRRIIHLADRPALSSLSRDLSNAGDTPAAGGPALSRRCRVGGGPLPCPWSVKRKPRATQRGHCPQPNASQPPASASASVPGPDVMAAPEAGPRPPHDARTSDPGAAQGWRRAEAGFGARMEARTATTRTPRHRRAQQDRAPTVRPTADATERSQHLEVRARPRFRRASGADEPDGFPDTPRGVLRFFAVQTCRARTEWATAPGLGHSGVPSYRAASSSARARRRQPSSIWSGPAKVKHRRASWSPLRTSPSCSSAAG